MKPKLSERAVRLAQVKRGLDQLADGYYVRLPIIDDKELNDVFRSFDRLSVVASERENSLRSQNVQLAASVSRMEKLLDASIDGIAFLGQDGAFKYVNRRFCEILGLRVGMLSKRTAADAHLLWRDSVKDPARLKQVISPTPKDGGDGRLDVVNDVVELAGTEPRYAQVYGAPVLDDDSVYAGRIISLHDNTREIELDRLKTEFISVVSHELRTPLTSIKGYTDLMLSGATGDINEIQREFLGILQTNANRLGNLINDILDLSKIEGGRIEVKREAVDYGKVVGDLVRLMKASADEKDISLDVSFPQNMPYVAGDSDKVSQVVSNLLSNAIKYTPEGGWIKVLIEVTEDAMVKTCIADSGIGISVDDQKKLFQKFFRADNSLTRQAGGTGLGLVIVKSIIELLGGTIWVQSETGRGTKFFYTLPIFTGKSSEHSTAGAPVPDRGIALVLAVESSLVVRETLQQALHRRGYGVITAATSEEALQKARQHRPDVILVNIVMDHCRGMEALTALRGDPATESMPVIAFSMQSEGKTDKIALGPVSFGKLPIVEKALTAYLEDRATLLKEEPYVLIVSLSSQMRELAEATAQLLRDRKIMTGIAESAGDAIASIVSMQPDAIFVEPVSLTDEALSSLFRALNSEVDFARIPIIVCTDDWNTEGILFHLGDYRPDIRPAVDYVGEKVAAVVRANAIPKPQRKSDDAIPGSGILVDIESK